MNKEQDCSSEKPSQPKRPFLEYWEELEKLELQRRKGHIPDDRYVMTLAFIDAIGPESFIEQAYETNAV